MPRKPKSGSQQSHRERAGLYVRVSLDRSAHGMQDEILSPETQEHRAQAYCQAQNWPVSAVERDIDESAYRQHYSQRAGLMRLLAAAEAGEITKIVVWKFSRLSRRLKEFIEICDRVEAAGGGVVSVTEQVDTSTPAGRLIRNILASFAQFQSEEISEQIFETWLTKARRGERPPGFAPFGTRNSRGLLEPDPETHPRLLAIFRTYRDTASLKATWDYLTAQRVPAPKAAAWNLNTIRGILANPVYIGQIHWAGEVFPGQWAPLIPPDLWEAVQQQLHARQTLPTRRHDARLLTGLLRCSGCGRPMYTRYGKRAEHGLTILARLYWCQSPHNGRKGCRIPALHAEELESAVWDLIETLSRGRSLGTLLQIAQQQFATRPDDPARRLQHLTAEREKWERAIATLFDLLAEGAITRDQLKGQNARCLERLQAVQSELADLQPPARGPEPAEIRAAAARVWDASTARERRRILAACGADLLVTPNRVYLHLLGQRFHLHARLLGNTFHFGPQYQRLDYQGPLLTDRQLRFIRRTYAWADKRRLSARLGREYATLITRARALGLAPAGRGRWRRNTGDRTEMHSEAGN